MFWTVSLSIVCRFSLYTHSNDICHKVLLTACEQDQDGTFDDGQRNCPKHVEIQFKNKFEKLVHLVGFILRSCPTEFNMCPKGPLSRIFTIFVTENKISNIVTQKYE